MLMGARLAQIRRDQSGFTLIELLVAMALGMIVIGAALALMDSGARSSTRTADRVDVTQRGRNAMNQIQRGMRSQVCLDSSTPPITAASNNSVSYYADSDGDPYFRPQFRTLYYDSTWKGGRGAIRETTTTADQASPPFTFTGTPADRVLVEDVTLQPGTPFLRYYAFDDTTTPGDEGASPLTTPLDTNIATDPLPANSMAKVVHIDVSFRVFPTRAGDVSGAPVGNQNDPTRDSDFDTSVWLRNSDYTDQAQGGQKNRVWGPRCS
jgi:prepilin-type N-terminal cleavage/methylation domain-containing protein